MSEPVTTYPAPNLEAFLPPPTKFEREYRAFLRLLPELLRAHEGKYVAIHEEKVAGVGDDKITLALDVWRRFGNVPIFVGRVSTEPVETVRLPHFRVLSEDRRP
jgi:hypothetical protein